MPLHLGTLHLKHFQCPTPNPLYSAASANKDLQDPSTGPPSPLQSSLPLVLVQTLQPSPACWTQCSPGFLLLLRLFLPHHFISTLENLIILHIPGSKTAFSVKSSLISTSLACSSELPWYLLPLDLFHGIVFLFSTGW